MVQHDQLSPGKVGQSRMTVPCDSRHTARACEVVLKEDGLCFALAITLGMAAAIAMTQPYVQPQACSRAVVQSCSRAVVRVQGSP